MALATVSVAFGFHDGGAEVGIVDKLQGGVFDKTLRIRAGGSRSLHLRGG